MAALDFLSNVETAFLKVLSDNIILRLYNWQRWDSDKELDYPRGVLALRSRTDPNETPYQRIDVTIKFEGLPKRQKLSVVMNEARKLLQTTQTTDLDTASKNTVKFIGKADMISEDRPIVSGMRTWTLSFVLYALPMV